MTHIKSEQRRRTYSAFWPVAWHGDRVRLGRIEQNGDRVDTNTIAYNVGGVFNECAHTQTSSYSNPPATTAGSAGTLNWHIIGGSYSAGTMPSCEPIPNPLDRAFAAPSLSGVSTRYIEYDAAQLTNKRMDAYNRLVHLAPERHMNVDQAVMELKDSEQTLGGFIAFMKWARSRFGKHVRRSAKKFTFLNAASRIADVASCYLWYKFGVEPTVSDVHRFLDEMSVGKLRVRGIKATHYSKGQVIKSYYSVKPELDKIMALLWKDASCEYGEWTVNAPANGGGTYLSLAGAVSSSGLSTRPFYGYPVRVTSLRGCYMARFTQDVNIDGLHELKRRWEWNCPSFRTLWELLPFSFLIDWVTNVGSTIERLEKRYLSQNYRDALGAIWRGEQTVVKTWYPRFERITSTCEPLQPPTSPHSGGSVKLRWWVKHGYDSGRAVSKTYLRQQVAPPRAVSPILESTVKAYQITTGMALLMQLGKSWLSRR